MPEKIRDTRMHFHRMGDVGWACGKPHSYEYPHATGDMNHVTCDECRAAVEAVELEAVKERYKPKVVNDGDKETVRVPEANVPNEGTGPVLLGNPTVPTV